MNTIFINRREEDIKKILLEPYKIGEKVYYNIIHEYIKTEKVKKGKKIIEETKDASIKLNGYCTIVELYNDTVLCDFSENRSRLNIYELLKLNLLPDQKGHSNYSSLHILFKHQIKKDLSNVGYNPFPKKSWFSRISFFNTSLDSLLFRCGIDTRTKTLKKETLNGIEIFETDFNPIIVDKSGNEIIYQRDLVWDINDKQKLIDSIINYRDIGKFLIRRMSFKWVENRINKGIYDHTNFIQIVDGKQRLTAIFEFINNRYPTKDGIYFAEFSPMAIHNFFNISIVMGEIGEEASDLDILDIFLNMNTGGKSVSEEHLNKITDIKNNL